MKHILYATDFSDNSENALDYALQLLKNEECFYTLLHVIPYVYPSDELYDYAYTLNESDVETSFDNLLKKYKKALSTKGNFYETKVESGSVAQVIADYADKKQMDLVLIGTKGAGKKDDYFIGSTAASMVKRTHCPVLVVPEKSTFKKPSKIVFALDFKEKMSEETIQPLIFLAKKYKSEILLLQVKKDETDTINEAVLGLRVHSSLEGIDHSYHTVYDKDIPHAIEQFVNDKKADIIVMITHYHHLFERIFHKSITKKMLLHSTLPLLVLDHSR